MESEKSAKERKVITTASTSFLKKTPLEELKKELAERLEKRRDYINKYASFEPDEWVQNNIRIRQLRRAINRAK